MNKRIDIHHAVRLLVHYRSLMDDWEEIQRETTKLAQEMRRVLGKHDDSGNLTEIAEALAAEVTWQGLEHGAPESPARPD